MSRRWLALVLLLVPREERSRWAAEWEVDLAACDELDMNESQVLRSLLVAALSLRLAATQSVVALHWSHMNWWRFITVMVLFPVVVGLFTVTATRAVDAPKVRVERVQPDEQGEPVYVLDPATGAIVRTDLE